MQLYKIFVIAFIAALIAAVVLGVSYFMSMMNLMAHANELDNEKNPAVVFGMLFTPLTIISTVLVILATFTYKILGIIFVARNPNVDSTEKIIWILGFIIFGFITAIIFMALQKSRNLLATAPVVHFPEPMQPQ